LDTIFTEGTNVFQAGHVEVSRRVERTLAAVAGGEMVVEAWIVRTAEE
jgi:hypothetical protein